MKNKGQKTTQHFIFYDWIYEHRVNENCVPKHQMTYWFDFTTFKGLRITPSSGKNNNRGKENKSGGKQRLTFF